MVTSAGSDDGERTLIARIAANDPVAFETFYHAYVRRAFAFAFTLTGVTDLAEEIAGDTMVEVWRSAHRYTGRARVATGVFAIAHHRAIGMLRRKHVNVVPLDVANPDSVRSFVRQASALGRIDAIREAAVALTGELESLQRVCVFEAAKSRHERCLVERGC